MHLQAQSSDFIWRKISKNMPCSNYLWRLKPNKKVEKKGPPCFFPDCKCLNQIKNLSTLHDAGNNSFLQIERFSHNLLRMLLHVVDNKLLLNFPSIHPANRK